MLKGSNLDGRKFRRQHSVGNYVLDFYCDSERLAVELDGEVHFDALAEIHDQERRRFLLSQGIRVVRFENKLVFEETERVLSRIRENFGWWKN
jgi:very-short-patch-repair endonuclease